MQHEGDKGRSRLGFADPAYDVIGAMLEVHRGLGPGLLESVYERCLAKELELRGMKFERQVALPLRYKGFDLDLSHRLDLVVDGSVIVELKSVEQLTNVHVAQLVTYLKLTGIPVGLLVNFNVCLLRDGLKRVWLAPTRPSFFPSPLRVPPPRGRSDG